MITPEDIIERESTLMGRPVRLIHMQTAVISFRGREYEVATALYDATLANSDFGTHPQLRQATYVDGQQIGSYIVGSWVER